MSLLHIGRLFLGKQRPQCGYAAGGVFSLTLLTVDRIGSHQTESYLLIWTGPEACAFWASHRFDLVPGAALAVELGAVRVHTVGGKYGGLTAQMVGTVNSMRLLPVTPTDGDAGSALCCDPEKEAA